LIKKYKNGIDFNDAKSLAKEILAASANAAINYGQD